MDRKLVQKQIQNCTVEELTEWRSHAVKCLDYYLKYRNEFEVDECHFVISHIDKQLTKVK